jgi:putative redox protein
MQTYTVTVERTDASHVTAATREFRLTLGARRADLTAGFNPVETMLAAMGSCLLTALQMVAELSRLPVGSMAMELEAVRQDKPPTVVSAQYRLTVESPLPEERVVRLVHLAETNSTVFQTLSRAFPIERTVHVVTSGTALNGEDE